MWLGEEKGRSIAYGARGPLPDQMRMSAPRGLCTLLACLMLPASCFFAGRDGSLVQEALPPTSILPGRLLGEVQATVPFRIPDGTSVLSIQSRSRELPAAWSSPLFRKSLERFVEEGGGLLLIGYAVKLCESLDLGRLAQVGAMQYGIRGEGLGRGFRFGISNGDEAKELLAGEPPEIFFDSGTHVRLEYCLLDPNELNEAYGWARLLREREGSQSTSNLAALAAWKRGKGRICAVGLGPIRSSEGAALLEHLRLWLAKGKKGGFYAKLKELSPDPVIDGWLNPEPEMALPPFFASERTRIPSLAHFGMRLGRSLLIKGEAKSMLQLALRKGADFFLAEEGLPSTGNPAELRRLASWLHARGAMLGIDSSFDAQEEGAGALMEEEAWLDDLARNYLDVRRYGNSALDGAGSKSLVDDGFGNATRRLWEEQPAAFVLGKRPRSSAASIARLPSVAGRLADLPMSGLTEPMLSRVFPPQLFPLLEVDTRKERGAYPDWIHLQALQFVRRRLKTSAAILLDVPVRLDPERLSLFLDLVRDPLWSASSFPLAATGKGGQRESLARLLDTKPKWLRASSEANCARSVLQNRFFRLEGSLGALSFDPGRRGGFDPKHDRPQVLSKNFLTSRLHGVRLGPGYLIEAKGVFKIGARPGQGGGTLHIGHDMRGWPRGLGLSHTLGSIGEQGWPRIVQQALEVPPGKYSLRIKGKAGQGGAMVEVSLDDRVLGFLSGMEGEKLELSVSFEFARKRRTTLRLELVHGKSFRFMSASYRRIGDVAMEVVSAPSAGPRALLREELWSSFFSETRRIVTLGDLPAFMMDFRYHRVSKGLRLDRFISLPGYELSSGPSALDAENVPFVLRDTSGRKPRLWLYVLGLRRNHEIDFEDGKGLAITTYPHNNDGYRIVCVFADELGRSVDPRALEAAFDEFLHPPKLVPRIGIAAITHPYPFPWRRCLQIPQAGDSGFEIAEGGRWRQVWPGSGGDLERCLLVATGEASMIEFRFGSERRYPASPGAARLLCFRELGDAVLEIELLRSSVFCTRPGLELPGNSGDVLLDGKRWQYRDGDRVYLPRSPGKHLLSFEEGGWEGPSLVATAAEVVRCNYDAAADELQIEIRHPVLAGAIVPGELPAYVLALRGPKPYSLTGGVLLEDRFRFAGGNDSEVGQYRVLAPPGLLRFRFKRPAAKPR